MRASRVLLLILYLLLSVVARSDQSEEPIQQQEAPPPTTNEAPEGTDPLANHASASQELLHLHMATEEMLQTHDRGVHALVTDVTSQIEAMLAEIELLRENEESLVLRTENLDAMIKQTNVMQLDYLAWRLSEVVKKELQTRNDVTSINTPIQVEDLTHAISLDVLHSELDPEKAVSVSDDDIENWLLGIGREEIESYQRQRSEKAAAAAQISKLSNPRCVSPLEAAHMVHGAIMNFENDFIGMRDHTRGAVIVHELTSDTYVAPPQSEELMGNVWWRKYIPVDWERALPSGWESWSVALPSEIQQVIGIQGSSTLPPEAIFDPSTIPGSCWPMRGSSGHVTMRLPYPVKVSAVTVDHASPLLLNNTLDVSSAPRKIRLIGYPPCSDDCRGLGFDLSKGTVLATINYDRDGRHIQTFDLSGSSDAPESDCAESKVVQGSCSAPPDFDLQATIVPESAREVSGIRLEVLSNWGVDEYTCLYRFRVHGQASQ